MIDNKLVADFKRPKNVELKKDIDEKNFGIFSAKPYERGFATTIGNSIRRTLLSSMSGFAIIAFRCDKINNEFQNIEGVYQDTTEILVNLKNVYIALKDPNIKSRVLHFDVSGKRDFLAGDFALDSNIQIGNPDALIFNTNKDANFSFDVQVDYGKGYVPSEMFDDLIEVDGTIAIDGNYSPILNVAFSVENVRVGNRNDYEKLNIEIKTKGVITPEDALKNAAQILKESYLTFNNVETEEVLTKAVDNKKESVDSEKDQIFYKSTYTITFTVRTHFFLKLNDIREIGQLVTKSEEELRDKKKFTEEILVDIKEKLKELNLKIDMKNISYVQKGMI